MATKISLSSIRVEDSRAKYNAKAEGRTFGGWGMWGFGIGTISNECFYQGRYKDAVHAAKVEAQKQGKYVVIVLE